MPRYANITDLTEVFADVGSYDIKISLPEFDFVLESGSVYRLDDAGTVAKLYRDKKDLGTATGSLAVISGSDAWSYNSGSDTLFVNLASSPTGSLFEASSKDWVNAQNLALDNASEQFESHIDTRFPRPIPKTKTSNSDRDYDTYVIKATALFAAIELLNATEPDSPLIEKFSERLFNEDESGIIDRINNNEIRFSFETTDSDRAGEIREVSIDASTTGYPTHPIGVTDTVFDIVRITITAGGTLTKSSANSTIKYKTQDIEGNQLITATLVDGFYQATGAGPSIRFTEGVYSASDAWEIELHGERTIGKNLRTVGLSRT